MDISQLLGEKYLERFRIFYPVTLFPPNWDALLKNACPLCGCKLKKPKTKRILFCNSVKHPKPYIISLQRLNDIRFKYKKS